jgi:hypothetical protein
VLRIGGKNKESTHYKGRVAQKQAHITGGIGYFTLKFNIEFFMKKYKKKSLGNAYKTLKFCFFLMKSLSM